MEKHQLYEFLFRLTEGTRSHDDLTNSSTSDGDGKYVHLKNIEVSSVSCVFVQEIEQSCFKGLYHILNK